MSPCRLRVYPARPPGLWDENPPLLSPCRVRAVGSMNFPQFSRILPYRDYDSATGLFINNKTVGYMFEARPLPGADKVIVSTLEHLLRSKLLRHGRRLQVPV
ncbi:TraC family protein [Klebsiella michiganensis]|uniref:TraC family protein n=1 Tax=Klebsiella michiganensis TaxID=1134687 RepID=UPI00311DF875